MSKSILPLLCLAVLLASPACSSSSSSPVAPDPAKSAASAATPAARTVYPSDGPSVVAMVASRYPEYLAAHVSADQRRRNMEFLRDRIVDSGVCGGMNLAWNRKRNGERSLDAIDWRHGDRDVNDVIDLASDWDNTSRPIALHWVITSGPAGWDPAPGPACP